MLEDKVKEIVQQCYLIHQVDRQCLLQVRYWGGWGFFKVKCLHTGEIWERGGEEGYLGVLRDRIATSIC